MNEKNLIVEDVRRIRHKISARFGHDTDKYIAHLRKLEAAEAKKRTKRRLVPEPAAAK
ncbi:MAG: hypothetical protein HY043_06900 [Verrucomicrobia bacterium]|nr:hypothetical protein [Verrucomicrobiota bacterium]